MSNHVQVVSFCVIFNMEFTFFSHRTYTYNDRRYGHYQPNGKINSPDNLKGNQLNYEN